jgi:ribonuclease HI
MEIMAAIVAIESLKEKCQVEIFSDSQYLVNAIAKGWAKRWQKHGWKRNKREMAINTDLWARLLKACESQKIRFHWIERSSTPENSRCDWLAHRAAMKPDLSIDIGYEHPPNRLL